MARALGSRNEEEARQALKFFLEYYEQHKLDNTCLYPGAAETLAEFGIDLSMGTKRRHLCRFCLDWTERRPHIGGAAGAALANRFFDLGWTQRMKNSRAVIVTESGKRGFAETFGIAVPEEHGLTLASA